MKSFIVLSESPLKVRKIIIYCFLISVLVPELLKFKDLKKTTEKMVQETLGETTRAWIKSNKINIICDVMWWTSDSTMSRQILV